MGFYPLAFIEQNGFDVNKRIELGGSYKVNNLYCDRPQIKVEGGWSGIIGDGPGCAELSVSDESKNTCKFVDPTTLVFIDKTDTTNCKLLFDYNKKE